MDKELQVFVSHMAFNKAFNIEGLNRMMLSFFREIAINERATFIKMFSESQRCGFLYLPVDSAVQSQLLTAVAAMSESHIQFLSRQHCCLFHPIAPHDAIAHFASIDTSKVHPSTRVSHVSLFAQAYWVSFHLLSLFGQSCQFFFHRKRHHRCYGETLSTSGHFRHPIFRLR